MPELQHARQVLRPMLLLVAVDVDPDPEESRLDTHVVEHPRELRDNI